MSTGDPKGCVWEQQILERQTALHSCTSWMEP